MTLVYQWFDLPVDSLFSGLENENMSERNDNLWP